MAPGLVAVGAPTLRAIRATTPTPPTPRLAIAHPSRTTVMAGEPTFARFTRRFVVSCGIRWRLRGVFCNRVRSDPIVEHLDVLRNSPAGTFWVGNAVR